MKAARFDYVKSATLPEALDMLQSGKPIAGSQSMGPMLNLRLARPARVIDVSRIADLRHVNETKEGIRIGASVTHAEIEDGKHELLRHAFFQHVASGIAYRAIRNRGTMGGSLAHADPAADWPLALAALDARIELAKAGATRVVRASEFMLGAFRTLLEEGEMITAILLPKLGPTLRWGYYKLCRKTGEFPHASAAAAFDARTGLARVVLGALDGPPAALETLAKRIAQNGAAAATEDALQSAVAEAMPNADSIDRQMHTAALERCLAHAFGTSTS
ncbi:MAG: Molybdopterin dehydrogenase, FAD-binding subunit [uncultured Paraburkholderia sp.]|nr:MAG: Molybdopterin dehydrogenase, FAD-binding subunit [uncultured Paraburkholderia sp.]CAH2805137.1 MAG: Molybdopterin dehydrogenase, FAD-binding subunit [uncultured Paraburkholderia sp.]CAH2940213.1 MAG: Molybdopterin dehydrogenase, FAD-binding subunit [uncultured Paraburkholderia sp.]CAH2942009.1 MAG: Molybdopterin dehydrogenase, FAD-binding subunit [uncultured Paraburkholderia sp.]